MGCDIHLYMEYRVKNPKDDYDLRWKSFGGRVNPGRHYDVFANLAGVRNYNKVTPVIPVRALPDDAGYHARADNQLYITDDNPDCESHASTENAAKWVSEGSSAYIEHGGRNVWVTHPDWHSHSWATPDELEQALAGLDWTVEYKAVLAALRSFEAQGYIARAVFWFDN